MRLVAPGSLGDLKMSKQAEDIPSAIRVSVTNMILHQLTLHNYIKKPMSCLVRCLACLFCDVLCCECNCIIFPAPRCEYELGSLLGGDEDMQIQISSFTSGQPQSSKSGR